LVSYLTQMVVTQKCDLGVLLDHNAERLVLIDETGKVVEDDLFIALVSLLVLSSNESSAVVVPVSAPRVIEDLAERFSGRVIRSKTSYTAMLEKLESEGIQNNGTINQFQLYSDGLAFLFFLLSYLAERRLTLSQLLKEIPAFYISKRVIECPWPAKGRVIRSLIEEHHQQPMELLEGVKVIHPHGWTLVLPDSEEPVCRIYSEGFSQEIAESLTDWYADRVQQISKTFGPINPP
ncbi:MAG: nucleotidyltransferase, partial [Syntrophomonadaceae bacterium]|nr:nucleotidyltransferase [Syntrophomonadaceae bacterium]